jgi:hypothetical protein
MNLGQVQAWITQIAEEGKARILHGFEVKVETRVLP